MSKILIWSDLHLHNWSYGKAYRSPYRSNYTNYRLESQVNSIKYALKGRVFDYGFFCGDFFHCHGKLEDKIISAGFELIDSLNIKNNHIMIPGNHDLSVNLFPYSYSAIDCFSRREKTFICRNLTYNQGEDFSWATIPFIKSKRILSRELDKINRIASGKDIRRPFLLFMHQGVQNQPMGSGYLIDEIFSPDMVPEGIDRCFTGHYHFHKQVDDKLTIVGAPMQHNWADVGQETGVLCYDTQTDEIERIFVNAPKFIKLSFDFVHLCLKMRRHDDIRNIVGGNFIKIVRVPIWARKIQLELKEMLQLQGAITQDMEYEEPKELVAKSSKGSSIMSPKEIFEDFIENNDLTKKQIEMGKRIVGL